MRRRFRGAQFFLLWVLRGKGGIFFPPFFGSQCVPSRFSKLFPTFPMCFLRHSRQNFIFYPILIGLPQLLIHCHIAKFSGAHYQIFQLCKYTLSSFQVSKLLHWHMHIVKFLGAYCEVFQVCGTDSKVYKHTLPSFPSLQLYVAKFVGAHCQVSDSKFSKLANPHCQVSKSVFSGWRVHIARFPNPFFQVDKFTLPSFPILQVCIVKFPSSEVHIAKFPNQQSQVDKFSSWQVDITFYF